MDLTNGSAIVTGGAGGFGSATVRRLAQKGAKVVIADVSDERGEALAREVGAGSLYVPTNCMDEDAVAKTVKAAAGLGPLRAAVITHIGPDWPGGRGPGRGFPGRGLGGGHPERPGRRLRPRLGAQPADRGGDAAAGAGLLHAGGGHRGGGAGLRDALGNPLRTSENTYRIGGGVSGFFRMTL